MKALRDVQVHSKNFLLNFPQRINNQGSKLCSFICNFQTIICYQDEWLFLRLRKQILLFKQNVSELAWELPITNLQVRFLGKSDDEFLFQRKIFENLQHQAAMKSPLSGLHYLHYQVYIQAPQAYYEVCIYLMFLVFQSKETRLELEQNKINYFLLVLPKLGSIAKWSLSSDFAPSEFFKFSGDTFGCLNSERRNAIGIQWVESRNIAKHPTMHSADLLN